MPSITIRFRTANPDPAPESLRSMLTEASAFLTRSLKDAFTADGPDLMGYDGELIDGLTIDAVIDDGRGVTTADRAAAAVDDEHEAKARSRAEED